MSNKLHTGETLVIATHNKGKLKEFREALSPFGLEVVSASELNLFEPEETGTTFRDNALLKARAASQASGLPALADDSGLCVTALDGNPGLFSARWCGPSKDPRVGMERIQRELGEATDRSAYFICVLAIAWPDGSEAVFEGRCSGQIVWPPVGENGHGYDPFFRPDGEDETFGQLTAAKKQALSHRARALQQFVQHICGA